MAIARRNACAKTPFAFERRDATREDDVMMRDYEGSNGYGRQVRHYDEDDGDDRRMRRRERDGGSRDDRESGRRREMRSDRYDEDAMPFARRHEEPQRLLGNTVASVWEITAQSRTSFEDAMRYGIERARETLRHIRGAWVQGQELVLRGNEIYAYRVQLKLTFVLDDR
jgi:flavin-binding protein dodecin